MFSIRSQTPVHPTASPFFSRESAPLPVASRLSLVDPDPFLFRASVAVAATDVLDGLARQPTLGMPAKLVWDANTGFAMIAELLRRGDLRQNQQRATETLDAALVWAERGSTQQPSAPGTTLVEILREAGCVVRPASPTSSFADIVLGRSVYRMLIAEWPSSTLQVSFPAATVRFESEAARRAVTLFALEANRRLRLARISVAPVGADRLRLAWDVVVRGDPCLTDCLPNALEALVVARDETARAQRMLRSDAIAHAYLAQRRQLTR